MRIKVFILSLIIFTFSDVQSQGGPYVDILSIATNRMLASSNKDISRNTSQALSSVIALERTLYLENRSSEMNFSNMLLMTFQFNRIENALNPGQLITGIGKGYIKRFIDNEMFPVFNPLNPTQIEIKNTLKRRQYRRKLNQEYEAVQAYTSSTLPLENSQRVYLIMSAFRNAIKLGMPDE